MNINTENRKFKIGSDCVFCDNRMSMLAVTRFVQDTAMAHTRTLNIHTERIIPEYNAHWVIAKMSVNIYKYPKFDDEVEVETYPMQPGLVKFDREAVVRKGEELVATYQSTWALVDATTKAIKRSNSIDYPNIKHRDRAFGEVFCTFTSPVFSEEDFCYDYKISLSDIDFNMHMNNVKYIKLVMNTFSMEEYKKTNIRKMDIYFREQTFYGEKIKVYRKDVGDETYVIGEKEKGKHIFECCLYKEVK